MRGEAIRLILHDAVARKRSRFIMSTSKRKSIKAKDFDAAFDEGDVITFSNNKRYRDSN